MGEDERQAMREVLGSRMREIREHLGLQQAAVADMIGVSRSYYNLIEKGKAKASVSLIRLFCHVFDISEKALIEGKELPNLPSVIGKAPVDDGKKHVSKSNGRPEEALREAGERVRKIRESLNMEPQEFASKIGIGVSSLAAVEKGHMHLSCGAWARIDEITMGKHPILLVDMENDIQRMVAACAIRRTFYTVRDEETVSNLKDFADATQTDILEVLVEVVIRKLSKIPEYYNTKPKD